jgi:acyl transferase domain-containing protein
MNFYNLKGLSYVVNAGAASALAALEHAVDCLKTRECDTVIAGGASAYLGALQWICLSEENRLSSAGPQPLTQQANGTVPSEGAVLFVLKRLSDAVRDQNKIYTVIRGIGHASNGKKAGPDRVLPETLQQAIQDALDQSHLCPQQIDQIEAHASAIPWEDACETEVLQALFPSTLKVGTLTSQMGCLFGASGAVSALKATLNLFLSKNSSDHPQRWGINSMGTWGQAYHLILEEWNPQTYPQQLKFNPILAVPQPPIAIVSMGAVLPNSTSVQEYWELILSGRSAAQEMPEPLWEGHRAAFFDSNPESPDKTYGSLGAFAIRSSLDPIIYGIPPIILKQLDPVHLQFLEAAHQALQPHSGDSAHWNDLPEKTSLIVGESKGSGQSSWNLALKETYLLLEHFLRKPIIRERLNWNYSKIENLLEHLQSRFPHLALPITEDTRSASLFSATLSRLGRTANVKGGHDVVDAACGSSLAALSTALRTLRLKKRDCIVFGGVGLSVTPANAIPFARCRALSATGSRPFDETADGIILGEGSVVLVLKRLEDALLQKDSIHAIIRGAGGASDGKGHSMMAPSTSGQILAMKNAFDQAGISPTEIDYIECHATGTPIGDESEINSVSEGYSSSSRTDLLRIGSVKAQIGHTIGAAGAAGLLKVILGLKNEVFPPTPVKKRVHPKFKLESMKLKINTEPEPWTLAPGKTSRLAAVSAFGFGGTNWHAIVEQAPRTPSMRRRKKHIPCAFVFPGHGAPYPDMGIQHFARSAVFRSAFQEANEVLASLLGRPLEHFVYRQFGSTREQIENYLLQPELVQPILLTLDIAYYRMLRDLKITPEVLLGHSVGEFAAAVASGLLSFEQAIWAIYQRGKIFKEHQQQGTDTGRMAAVFASEKALKHALHQQLELPIFIANLNCPSQSVISGPTPAIATAIRELNLIGIESKLLKVQVAWHSPLAYELGHLSAQKVFESLEVQSPRIQILSNVDQTYYSSNSNVKDQLVRNWVAQLGSQMNFPQCIEKLYTDGYQNFIEVGPKQILSSFISEILENRPHRIWSTDRSSKTDSGLSIRQIAFEVQHA